MPPSFIAFFFIYTGYVGLFIPPEFLIPIFLLCILGKVDNPALIVLEVTPIDIGVEDLLNPDNLPQENLPDIPLVEIPTRDVSVLTPATNSAVLDVVL